MMGSRIVFLKDGQVYREKEIDDSIRSCCCGDLGQDDCLRLKAELAGWYE